MEASDDYRGAGSERLVRQGFVTGPAAVAIAILCPKTCIWGKADMSDL